MERLKRLANILLVTFVITVGVYLGVIIGGWAGIIVGTAIGQVWVQMEGGPQ